jgi:ATPase subunit of ABC transporter with duplicated ATPase domains
VSLTRNIRKDDADGVDSFYATKEERKKNAKREYEKQMAERAHLQGWSSAFPFDSLH